MVFRKFFEVAAFTDFIRKVVISENISAFVAFNVIYILKL